MRQLLIILLMIASGCPVIKAQNLSDMDAIMALSGSDDPLEMDSDEVEKLEHLLTDPLRLNSASESHLRSCGLFSSYQVAVITDYISEHGPIRSMMEMSLLDGFGEDFVRKLAPFIILESGKTMNMISGKGVRHDVATRGGLIWREDTGFDGNYALKFRVDYPSRFTASFASSRKSGSFSWHFKSIPMNLTIGDFYARFGQGLVLWSNSFMNNLTSPETFMKKPSGITQPWSFTGDNAVTGIAADYEVGKCKISVIADLSDLVTAVNIAWYCRNGHASVTNHVDFPRTGNDPQIAVMTGLDAAFCIRGVNVFGEVAYGWLKRLTSMVAGTRFKAGESVDMAIQLRALDKEEYGAAMSGNYRFGKKLPSVGTLSIDFVHYPVSKEEGEAYSLQLKSQFLWEVSLAEQWTVKLRLSERIRTWGLPFRTDIRSDLIYSFLPFSISMRVNVLSCDKVGVLSYLDGGYKGDKVSLYLRQGVFLIDDWDDRIYVYERDAPGSFNAPAMYGRGLWSAVTASWNAARFLRLYIRASFTGYPFMEKKKPGKAELKLQLQYRF